MLRLLLIRFQRSLPPPALSFPPPLLRSPLNDYIRSYGRGLSSAWRGGAGVGDDAGVCARHWFSLITMSIFTECLSPPFRVSPSVSSVVTVFSFSSRLVLCSPRETQGRMPSTKKRCPELRHPQTPPAHIPIPRMLMRQACRLYPGACLCYAISKVPLSMYVPAGIWTCVRMPVRA